MIGGGGGMGIAVEEGRGMEDGGERMKKSLSAGP